MSSIPWPPDTTIPTHGPADGLASLRLDKAHALATGKGVKIAVIDTGLDLSHPDLAGKVVRASSFLSWGERAFTGDVHGTAVAGVIAADANNGQGIVGVAPDAELLALKACGRTPRARARRSATATPWPRPWTSPCARARRCST